MTPPAAAIDMRCAGSPGDAHRDCGFAGRVEDLAHPIGSSAWPGDAGKVTSEPRCWPCIPWTPSADALAQADELIGRAGAWRGMVRCTLDRPGAGVALSEWSIGPVATALADAGVPLAIDLSTSQVDLDAVFTLAVAHPTLSIVLRSDRRFDPALALALFAAVANVAVETSGISPSALREAVKIDPRRVVFGSSFPTNEPGEELGRVTSSVEDPTLLDEIVAGNALSLLEP